MSKHILVIEDEEHLAVGIKFNLQAEGYKVMTAGDGPAALKLLNQPGSQFDLVILDLMLPGMSGYAVCESMRAGDHDMPVLILSARTLAEDRTRGFDVGADQYLMKPFDLDELLSRVKGLLLRHGGQRIKPAEEPLVKFQFGGAKINFETFEASMAGEPVRLTQLEVRLLQYFIKNEGRVIPRAELLEQVFERPGHLITRGPDQFIRRLRKAFEPDPANPRHFLTIRDAGYRFVADDGEDAEETS